MPGVMSPSPIPGVSDPAQAPPDRMAQLAQMMGQTKAEDTVSALDDMTQAMNLLQSAAKKDSRLGPIVQEVMGVINKTQAPPQGGGISTPQPPGGGMAQPPLPPGMM
jgi:hypothetical protein